MAPAPGEVLVELAAERIGRRRRFDDPRRDPRGEALEHGVEVLLGEREPHEPALGHGRSQLAERRVERGVAHVGQALRRDPLAESPRGVGRAGRVGCARALVACAALA